MPGSNPMGTERTDIVPVLPWNVVPIRRRLRPLHRAPIARMQDDPDAVVPEKADPPTDPAEPGHAGSGAGGSSIDEAIRSDVVARDPALRKLLVKIAEARRATQTPLGPSHDPPNSA